MVWFSRRISVTVRNYLVLQADPFKCEEMVWFGTFLHKCEEIVCFGRLICVNVRKWFGLTG
jgi:hypothetical protein